MTKDATTSVRAPRNHRLSLLTNSIKAKVVTQKIYQRWGRNRKVWWKNKFLFVVSSSEGYKIQYGYKKKSMGHVNLVIIGGNSCMCVDNQDTLKKIVGIKQAQ